MIPSSRGRSIRKRAFTLVELATVAAIISALAVLAFPAFKQAQYKAMNVACTVNLQEIGKALSLASIDNDNVYPYIENDLANPIYPPEYEAKTLLDTLSPYGINEQTLQCPLDRRGQDEFAKRGSSYEWKPFADGEPVTQPNFYGRRGTWPIKPSRLRLANDYWPVHNGKMFVLFADGTVQAF